MGFEAPNPFSLPAGSDLSASQYCAVALNSSGQLALPSAGGAAIGILYTKPAASGRAGEVYGPGSGIRKGKYGGTVTKGDVLKLDSAGKFITASAGDIALGSGVAIAVESGSASDIGTVLFFGGASTVAQIGGVQSLAVLQTDALVSTNRAIYISTTGTKTGALPNGSYTGQVISIIQSVAASTPVGTVTGTFKTFAGAAATTLALGTAVAFIQDYVWDSAAWRAMSALGGTGSSLS